MSTGNPGPHGWSTTTVSQENLLIVIADDKVTMSVGVRDAQKTTKTTVVDRKTGEVIPPDAT